MASRANKGLRYIYIYIYLPKQLVRSEQKSYKFKIIYFATHPHKLVLFCCTPLSAIVLCMVEIIQIG